MSVVNPRTIRVAHVAPGLDVGGLEKLLVEFGRHADRSQFSLRFVSLTTRGPIADELADLGWPVDALQKPEGLKPGLVFRLAALLRRYRIDAVHTHDNGPLIYAAPAARLAGVRVVLHSRHQQNARAGRRETGAFVAATRLADRVVCVSADSAALCAREGVSPRKLRTILNGVDTARFALTGPAADGPAVCVARLSPEKGVEFLVRAAAEALAADPAFRLEIAGDGPLRDELERLVAELGVSRAVRFLGSVRDVPGLLARASLFVLPSLTEGIPVTLLEAMGRGLPVVATSVGGTPEVVQEGVTGRLVPSADPNALARAMLGVRADPETGRRLGLAGRRRVEDRFDVRRMVGEYERLYLEAGRGRLARVAGPEAASRATAAALESS